MTKIKCLLGWMAILGILAMTVVPAEARPRRARRNCPCVTQNYAPKAIAAPCTFSGSVCLQYLLYADELIEMWIADQYDSSPCTGNITQIYMFTEPGATAPQGCTEEGPLCMAYCINGTDSDPHMTVPLIGTESYIDRLRHIQKRVDVVRPVLGTPTRVSQWDPAEGLGHGQDDKVEVKVRNAADTGWVVVRLSSGFSNQNQLTYRPRPRPPVTHPRPRRDVRIGFEVAMYQGDVESLPPAIAQKWTGYDSGTAFTIEWQMNGRVEKYHCLTKLPVKVIP